MDVINSNLHKNERNLVTLEWRKSLLWNRHFQNLRILHAFARNKSNTKMNFSNRFSKFFKWQYDFTQKNDQTWFSDTLTSFRPLGGR